MILIIGGANQSKTKYAARLTGITCWCDGAACTKAEILSAEGIRNFEAFIQRVLQEGGDVSTLAEELLKNNKDVVIISQEIGYGLVPMDAVDRKFREETGRICTKLAAEAKEVHRVVCGIGTVIKHD